jgi:hypothetical protein
MLAGWSGDGAGLSTTLIVLNVIAFYEKVIKVKADVAAFLN